MKIAVIFGGSGFVGRHLVHYLSAGKHYDRLIVSDLIPPGQDIDQVTYIQTDLRKPIEDRLFRKFIGEDDQVHIYNLAAVCRIPGHEDREYFETNIPAADNVCAFADWIGCRTIVFISTIAVYDTSEETKRENSVPQPDNPYGISKLVAEHIHRTWQAQGEDRALHILRPGIIFGVDEGANFTRLYRSIRGRYFYYPGRKDTRKACVYVKDVARICHTLASSNKQLSVYNLCYSQAPTIEEICNSIARAVGTPPPRLVIPAWLLLMVAQFLRLVLGLVGRRNISLHPDRVRKLMLSTDISGEKLEGDGFRLGYTLAEALSDWNRENEGRGLF